MLDTHCHLDQYPSPLAVARSAERAGITVIAVTHLPSHYEQGRAHVASFKRVRLALGLHPLLAPQHASELAAFARLLPTTSYVGEIGLDFSQHGRATKDVQIRSFSEVLKLLRGNPRFVTLHSRGAEEATLSLLQEYEINGAVFHWFSGSMPCALRIADTGHYFSLNPAMVRTKKGQALLRALPREQVLVETDGPFLQVGSRPANPSDVAIVYTELASVWAVDREEAVSRVAGNFRNIISTLRRRADKCDG
jgi:TatD DNase family protein